MEGPHGTEASKPEDDRQEAEVPTQEVVRSAGEAQVPDRHEGPSGERQGALDPAVQGGEDLEVDSGSDSRGGESETEAFEINLGGPTPYTDHPDIPERFSAYFTIHLLPERAKPSILHSSVGEGMPGDGDVVSDTIRQLGVWEVAETITLLSAFEAAPPHTTFIDVGCHVGWYSILALDRGLDVVAIDGDYRMLDALKRSCAENADSGSDLMTFRTLIGKGWKPPIVNADNYVMKIDVEGHEDSVISGFWPLFRERKVSHLLMEVSPIFEGYYPDLLKSLIDLGYMAYAMPVKSMKPPVVDDVKYWIQHYGQNLHLLTAGSRRQWISQQTQFDVVLFHEGSQWG